MRMLSLFMLICGLLVVTGCDSNDDSSSDADMFVGTWQVAGLTDASGDRSAGLAESYNSVRITLGNAGNVTMAVDAKVAAASLTASGTYSINETDDTLTATLEVGGNPTPLTFSYEFVDDSTLQLTPTSTTTVLLGVLFQTQYANPVLFTFVKIS